jgi:hypothetical protein
VEYRIDATTILPDGNQLAKTRGELVDTFSGAARQKFARPSTGVLDGMTMAKE